MKNGDVLLWQRQKLDFEYYLHKILHICYQMLYMSNMISPILTYVHQSQGSHPNTNKDEVKDLLQTCLTY